MTDRQHAEESNQHLVDAFRPFSTFDELRRSDAFQRHARELDLLLGLPKVHQHPSTRPRLQSFLRVVQWNIERGSHMTAIVDVLNQHPVLRWADLLLLNELDVGMVRSGNCNVPLEFGRALEAHSIYGVEYLELTKGVGDELKLPGENTAALHGNAILTRYPFSNPRIVRLPRCEDNFSSAEKRLGGRIGLLVDLHIGSGTITIATAHLDVVGTPRCRGRQMRSLVEHIQSEPASGHVILGGDLNTHTFSRGGRLRAVTNVARILTCNRDRLTDLLLHPESKEPVFEELKRFGYEWESLNDRRATSRSIVSNLGDARSLPRPLQRWVSRRVGPSGLTLEFRLDWLAARGMKVMKAGVVRDEASGVVSIAPQTLRGLRVAGGPISDHDPIAADLAFPL